VRSLGLLSFLWCLDSFGWSWFLWFPSSLVPFGFLVLRLRFLVSPFLLVLWPLFLLVLLFLGPGLGSLVSLLGWF